MRMQEAPYSAHIDMASTLGPTNPKQISEAQNTPNNGILSSVDPC